MTGEGAICLIDTSVGRKLERKRDGVRRMSDL